MRLRKRILRWRSLASTRVAELTSGKRSRSNGACPRILFIHPDVYALGGAEQVCVRMINAAQRMGEVTLVHCGGVLDCERIRQWFRVTLDPERVRFATAGSTGRILGRMKRKPILKYAVALRYARQIASEFDLVVGTFGECPIPARHGIQYIHVPVFSSARDVFKYLNTGSDRPAQNRLRPLYARVSRLLNRWDLNEVSRKRTLVNSLWTAGVVREIYGLSSTVLSPGIEVQLKPGAPGWMNWSDRDLGFVMLGRIHPSKRLELGVEIVRRLHDRGHDVQLHIVGRGEGEYSERIRRLVAQIPYAHVHLDLARLELEQIVVRCKFGLHACAYEHYGIAAAEMQALGCVVFVPDFAGQREVVRNSEQRYTNAEDAVNKICRLLGNAKQCGQLSAEAAQKAAGESAQVFEERVSRILEDVLAS